MEAAVAPEPLLLIQDFVNTQDLDEGRDELATAAKLGAWLRERGLLDPAQDLSEEERERAVTVRETIRALLLANNSGEADAAPLEALNGCAGERCASFRLRFERGRAFLEPLGAGADAALGRILSAIGQCVADGSWPRLKACADDSCRWAFIDQSRNRAGHWCSMRVCGNRAKARQFRARRRATSA